MHGRGRRSTDATKTIGLAGAVISRSPRGVEPFRRRSDSHAQSFAVAGGPGGFVLPSHTSYALDETGGSRDRRLNLVEDVLHGGDTPMIIEAYYTGSNRCVSFDSASQRFAKTSGNIGGATSVVRSRSNERRSGPRRANTSGPDSSRHAQTVATSSDLTSARCNSKGVASELAYEHIELRGRRFSSKDASSSASTISDAKMERGLPTRAQRLERPKPFELESFYESHVFILHCEGVVWDVMDVTGKRSNSCIERSIVDAVNAIYEAGKRVLFIGGQHSRSKCFERLSAMGIQVRGSAEECILTTGSVCAWHLGREAVKMPWVLTASKDLLQELRSRFPKCLATIEETGETIRAYKSVGTVSAAANIARVVETLDETDVDAVVIDSDPSLSLMKLAVASKLAMRTRDVRPFHKRKEEESPGSPNSGFSDVESDGADASTESTLHARQEPIPLITICGPSTKSALRSLEKNFLATPVSTTFGTLLQGTDPRLPSPVLRDLLQAPLEEGGYGVDFREATFVGTSVEAHIEFANEAGMRSLLVSRDVMLPVVGPTVPFGRRPTWVLRSLDDIGQG